MVSMKDIPPTMEVRTRARVLAVSMDPLRMNDRGISGALDRDSMARKAARIVADRASGINVHGDANPMTAALVIA